MAMRTYFFSAVLLLLGFSLASAVDFEHWKVLEKNNQLKELARLMRAEARAIEQSEGLVFLLPEGELVFITKYIKWVRLGDENRKAGAQLLGANLRRSIDIGDLSIESIVYILSVFKDAEAALPVLPDLLEFLVSIPDGVFPNNYTRLHVLALAAMASGVDADFQERAIKAFLECFSSSAEHTNALNYKDTLELQEGVYGSILLNLLRFDFNRVVEQKYFDELLSLLDWIFEVPIGLGVDITSRYTVLYRLMMTYGPRALNDDDVFARKFMSYLVGVCQIYVDCIWHAIEDPEYQENTELSLLVRRIPGELFDLICCEQQDRYREVFEAILHSCFVGRRSDTVSFHGVLTLSEAMVASIDLDRPIEFLTPALNDNYLYLAEYCDQERSPKTYGQLCILSAYILRKDNNMSALKRVALEFLERAVKQAVDKKEINEYLLDSLEAVRQDGSTRNRTFATKLLSLCTKLARRPYVMPDLNAQPHILIVEDDPVVVNTCNSQFVSSVMKTLERYQVLSHANRVSFIKEMLDTQLGADLVQLTPQAFYSVLASLECLFAQEASICVFEEGLFMLYAAWSKMPMCARRDIFKELCLRLREMRFMLVEERLNYIGEVAKKLYEGAQDIFMARGHHGAQNTTLVMTGSDDDPFPGGVAILAEGAETATGVRSISPRALQVLLGVGASASVLR